MAKKTATKKTYAEQAKAIMAKYKNRLGDGLTELDPMSEKSLIAELNALRQQQELHRATLEPDNTNMAPVMNPVVDDNSPEGMQQAAAATQFARKSFKEGGILEVNNKKPPNTIPVRNVYGGIQTPIGNPMDLYYESPGTALYNPYAPTATIVDPYQPKYATPTVPANLLTSRAPSSITKMDPLNPTRTFAIPANNTGVDPNTPTPVGDLADLKTSPISGTDAMIYGAQALPAIANLARGIFGKPKQLNAEDYQITANPIDAPEYDVSDELRSIEGQGNISRRNLRESMAGQIAAQTATNKAVSGVNQYKENVDAQNQFAADSFNSAQDVQVQGQNAQMEYGVDQFNIQSQAAKDNLTSLGLSQLSDLGQYVGTNELYQQALADNKTYMTKMIDAVNKNPQYDPFKGVAETAPQVSQVPVSDAMRNAPVPDYEGTLLGDGINDLLPKSSTPSKSTPSAAPGSIQNPVKPAIIQNAPAASEIPGYIESVDAIWNQDKSWTEKISETVKLTGQAGLDLLSKGNRFASGKTMKEELADKPLTTQEEVDLINLSNYIGINLLSFYKQDKPSPKTYPQTPNFNPIYNTAEIYNPAGKQAERAAYLNKLKMIGDKISTFDPYNTQ